MKFILWGKYNQGKVWRILGVYMTQRDADAELYWILQNELHSEEYKHLVALKVI